MRTFIFLNLFLLISCQNETKVNAFKNEKLRTMNEVSNIDSLREVALNYGDTNAYMRLRIAYLDYSHGSFLPIAKEMADNYKFRYAYYDAYYEMLQVTKNGNKVFSLDSLTNDEREIALDYLKLAANLNQLDALSDLGNLYLEGEFLIRDSLEGIRLLNKYDSILK